MWKDETRVLSSWFENCPRTNLRLRIGRIVPPEGESGLFHMFGFRETPLHNQYDYMSFIVCEGYMY
jgi:hypothetical protein